MSEKINILTVKSTQHNHIVKSMYISYPCADRLKKNYFWSSFENVFLLSFWTHHHDIKPSYVSYVLIYPSAIQCFDEKITKKRNARCYPVNEIKSCKSEVI